MFFGTIAKRKLQGIHFGAYPAKQEFSGNFCALQRFAGVVEKHTVPGRCQLGHQAADGINGVAAEEDGADQTLIHYQLVEGEIVAVVFQRLLAQGVGAQIVHTAPAQFPVGGKKCG